MLPLKMKYNVGIAESEYDEWDKDSEYLACPKPKPRGAGISSPNWDGSVISKKF